jgi:CRP-like cAMP-binding protein
MRESTQTVANHKIQIRGRKAAACAAGWLIFAQLLPVRLSSILGVSAAWGIQRSYPTFAGWRIPIPLVAQYEIPMKLRSHRAESALGERRTASFEGRKPESIVSTPSAESRAGYSLFDIYQWISTEAQEAFNRASRRRHFSDGCRIYSQSEPGDDMYRIVSGDVRMSVLRHDGREALHSLLEPGSCFGICSMLDGAPRHHTTTADGDVEVQILRRDACERLRSEHPSFGDGLIRHMSRHTRLLCEYFASSTLDELPCRVALRLLKASTPAVTGSKVCRVVRLSQSEIALMVGASRQAVNRVLQRFQDDGLISIDYGSVHVHDIDRLRSVVSAI